MDLKVIFAFGTIKGAYQCIESEYYGIYIKIYSIHNEKNFNKIM